MPIHAYICIYNYIYIKSQINASAKIELSPTWHSHLHWTLCCFVLSHSDGKAFLSRGSSIQLLTSASYLRGQMNLQVHLPTAIWEGEQGIHAGNLEPESVQDMVGGDAWGRVTQKHVHCSQKGKCKQQAKEQMKHLSHFSNVPPQGHYQKPTHVLFLS